jgi:hypothetical protein
VKISNVLILLGAVFAGLYLVPRLVTTARTPDTPDPYAQRDRAQIVAAIEEHVANFNPACLRVADSFPYDSRRDRQQCQACETLEQAGLLTRVFAEENDAAGNVRYVTRYELSQLGEAVYRPGSGGYNDASRFCFGEARLHEIKGIRRVMGPGAYVFGVRYQIEIVNPHPFLYDPRAEALGLKRPSEGTPALLPAQDAQFTQIPGGSLDWTY